MKKIVFVLLIIQPIFSNAQLDNFPTSNDNPIWGYYSVGGYLTSPEFALYGLIGDTIIDSKNYSKLYSLADTILSETAIKDFLGGIRVLDKKVYYFHTVTNKEMLLYDFSATLKDTVDFNDFGSAVVYDIDSISINGKIHKQFYLENPNYGTGKWIENIGSVYGLLINMLYPSDNNPPTTSLVCFKYKGTNYYPNYCCGCFETYLLKNSISKKRLQKNKISIYPNPINNESIISSISNEPILEISIYDIYGSKVRYEFVDSEIYHVGEVALKSGIYFLSVKMKNGNYYSTIFIKP